MLTKRLIYGAVFVFMVVFLSQAILSMWEDTPTFDEMVNSSVGYAELFSGDLRLVNDHPPLLRTLTALPLLAFNPLIPTDVYYYTGQKKKPDSEDRYYFARDFFYGANRDPDKMLFWSRMPVVFLSLLLGLLVFNWAKELYGDRAGLFALFLYVFEPNIMAHSRLTTNDLILALFLFSTIYQFWQHCDAPSRKSLVLTGISLGLALLSKFSALMLFPMLFLLALLGQKGQGAPSEAEPEIGTLRRFPRSVRFAGRAFQSGFLISLIAAGVVLIFYRAQWGQFIDGLCTSVAMYQGSEGEHKAFLMGDYSDHGWWYYFPVAFLLKTPVPILIYLMAAFLCFSFRRDRAEYFLLIPVGIIALSALLSHVNIGIRHVLPIYPFLIVLASSVTTIRSARPWLFAACFGGLALWYLVSSVSIFPSYLAYFNEFVGPKNGYLKLADSNLDWGQDLKRLKRFLDQKGIDRVYLSYFGTADPCHYYIKPVDLPGYPGFPSGCAIRQGNLRTDFIAISATNLQSVYLADKTSFNWLKAYQPAAQIGYSIFVYDIKGDSSAHSQLGLVYLKYGMLEHAISEFKLVTELTPDNSMAFANLGLVYSLTSLFEKAEGAYRGALRLDPENKAAKEGLKGLKRIAAQVE